MDNQRSPIHNVDNQFLSQQGTCSGNLIPLTTKVAENKPGLYVSGIGISSDMPAIEAENKGKLFQPPCTMYNNNFPPSDGIATPTTAAPFLLHPTITTFINAPLPWGPSSPVECRWWLSEQQQRLWNAAMVHEALYSSEQYKGHERWHIEPFLEQQQQHLHRELILTAHRQQSRMELVKQVKAEPNGVLDSITHHENCFITNTTHQKKDPFLANTEKQGQQQQHSRTHNAVPVAGGATVKKIEPTNSSEAHYFVYLQSSVKQPPQQQANRKEGCDYYEEKEESSSHSPTSMLLTHQNETAAAVVLPLKKREPRRRSNGDSNEPPSSKTPVPCCRGESNPIIYVDDDDDDNRKSSCSNEIVVIDHDDDDSAAIPIYPRKRRQLESSPLPPPPSVKRVKVSRHHPTKKTDRTVATNTSNKLSKSTTLASYHGDGGQPIIETQDREESRRNTSIKCPKKKQEKDSSNNNLCSVMNEYATWFQQSEENIMNFQRQREEDMRKPLK